MRQTTSLLVLVLSILSARVVGASECEDYLAKLDALMGREPTEEQFYPRRGGMFAGGGTSIRRGVPTSARWQVSDGTEVFRHYVKQDWQLLDIVESSRLEAGHLSYAQVSIGFRTYFEDLKGIFLTTPDVLAKDVGVEGSTYVDLRLPTGVRILKIEKNIWLLPGPPFRDGEGRRQLIAIEDHSPIDVTRGFPTYASKTNSHWRE